MLLSFYTFKYYSNMLRMRRGTTMTITACVGYMNTPIDHRLNSSDSNYNMLTRRVDQTFFDGKNYRWIIQCLNDGELFEKILFQF